VDEGVLPRRRRPLGWPRPAQMESALATSSPTRTWQCILCGFTYEEAAGLPQDGIAPGTRWEELPEDWTCPDCAAIKTDFSPVEA